MPSCLLFLFFCPLAVIVDCRKDKYAWTKSSGISLQDCVSFLTRFKKGGTECQSSANDCHLAISSARKPSLPRNRCRRSHSYSAQNGDTTLYFSFMFCITAFFGPAAIAEPVLRVQAEGASGFFGLSVLENVERQGQGVAEQSTFSHHCVLFPMNL